MWDLVPAIFCLGRRRRRRRVAFGVLEVGVRIVGWRSRGVLFFRMGFLLGGVGWDGVGVWVFMGVGTIGDKGWGYFRYGSK